MIELEKSLGNIEISHEYFAGLVGSVASSCFGVAGMATSGTIQGIKSLVTKDFNGQDKGVSVTAVDGKIIIDLHIIVTFGVNIKAVVKSIVNKVKYSVEEATGLEVMKVKVFVDGIKS